MKAPIQRWSDEDLALLHEHYTTTQTAVLADTLGRSMARVHSKANTLGLHKVPGSRVLPATQQLRQTLLALAGRHDRASGFGLASVPGVCNATANRVAAEMVDAGELHRVRLSHKIVRYFSGAEAAQRYRQGRPDYAAGAPGPEPAVRIGAGSSRAWWPADAEPRITAETKMTIAPAPVRQLRTNTHSPL